MTLVVDSSALIAIFDAEIDFEAYMAAILDAERLLISAVNVHETGIVLRSRHGAKGPRQLWRFLRDENDFEIAPFDARQAALAVSAFGRYGKGMRSKAKLNLADCAAYALARTHDAPLLYKGGDFSHTDLRACL